MIRMHPCDLKQEYLSIIVPWETSFVLMESASLGRTNVTTDLIVLMEAMKALKHVSLFVYVYESSFGGN